MRTMFSGPSCVRAAIAGDDAARRTATLVFSTGAPVLRTDGWGVSYREVLSMKPEHVRLERLNAGAPVLDAHSAYSVTRVLGVVEHARMDNGQGVALVRFSRRQDVEPIYQDVRDRIISSVSVGYHVHKFIEQRGKNAEVPTRTAVDWEPYEVSLVPMPSDAGAKIRGAVSLVPCVVEAAHDQADADRCRRLQFAQRSCMPSRPPAARLVDAPREPQVAAEKWAAVRQALEKFLALGQYGSRLPVALLPQFDLRWDDPAMAADAVGSTFFLRDGRIVLSLRSDRTSEEIHRTALHELAHVADHALVAAGLPTAILEERARLTAARLS